MSTHDEQPPPKKPYQPPRVEFYGTIREVTRDLGSTGMNDKGSGAVSKTGL